MKITVRQITFTAILTAFTALLSSFGVPLGFATIYLCDIAVCVAGIVLNPILAVIAGGFGTFIGDLIFYPKAMFVTLIIRTVQVLIISVFSHYILKKKPVLSSLIGAIIGIIVMAFGYSYFSALFYSSIEIALTKLPFEALQATVGVAVAIPLCYKFRLREICENYVKKDDISADDKTTDSDKKA
ncbi:MAG: ECF transporter S component [Clostridia bacterium]|nr:ECF transporter S component [Clostridia bacterium]